jgi:hypothetical protein
MFTIDEDGLFIKMSGHGTGSQPAKQIRKRSPTLFKRPSLNQIMRCIQFNETLVLAPIEIVAQ